MYWNVTKIFLARKWNSVEDRPVNRPRGFIVTKIKILKVVSFWGPETITGDLTFRKGVWTIPPSLTGSRVGV